MAILKSDSQGFLVGDPIDVKPSLYLLTDIRDEIRLLRTALTGGIKLKNSSITVNTPSSARRAPTTPRDASGRFVKSAATNQSTERFISTPTLRNIGKSVFRKSTHPDDPHATARFTGNSASDRDAIGRFTGRSGDSSSGFNLSGSSRSLLNGLPGRIGLAIGQSSADLQQADPTIQAANEAFSPLVTGYRTLFGSESSNSEDVPWYRRIFRELRFMRKDNSAYNKAETKALKDIEKKPVFGGGDGGSMLPAILAGLIPIAVGAFGLFTDKGQEILSGIANTFSQGWTATTAYFRDKWDKGLDYFGSLWDGASKKWDDSVKAFDDLWAPISTYLKEKFGIVTDAVNNAASSTVQVVSDTANKANTAVKNATGIDVKESAKSGYAKAVDFVSRNVIEPTANAIEAGKQAYSDYTNADMRLPGKSLSDVIRGGESGKAGYNAYNRGTVGNKILGPTGHRDLENMTIGEIMANQALPKSDVNRLFAVGKYQMIPDTLKAGVNALGLSQDTKFDKATQERLFSEYLLGKKRPQIERFIKGKGDINNAQLAMSQEWASVADPRTGRSFYDKTGGNSASISNNKAQSALLAANKLYQDNIKAGMPESEAYSMAVRGLGGQSPSLANLKPAVTATTTQTSPFINPSAPTLSQPPSIVDAEPVINPLSSRGKQDFISLDVKGMVNQDVSDPRIAHLVSGGYSRA